MLYGQGRFPRAVTTILPLVRQATKTGAKSTAKVAATAVWKTPLKILKVSHHRATTPLPP